MPDLSTHYHEIRGRFGYDPVDVDLGTLPATYLARKFAAVDGRRALAAAPDRATLVATGVGMTGPPHVGTLGQLHNAVVLQEAGLDVQLVLADLEPYHGGADLAEVRRLAARYRWLALELGFDPDSGVLRTQSEATAVMRSAHRQARYYAPGEDGYGPDAEPTDWEEAVAADYDAADTEEPGPTSEAAATHSTLLHLADFLHPLARRGYDQVVIQLGIDEHGLTLATRAFAAETPVEGAIVGLHGRLVPGLGPHPKMAKRIPGSGITLAMDPGTVSDRVREAAAGGGDPGDSPAFAMMRLASPCGPAELDRRASACRAGGETWEATVAEYADHLADLAGRW